MNPTAFLQAWNTKAPWPDMRQVEQALIISKGRAAAGAPGHEGDGKGDDRNCVSE